MKLQKPIWVAVFIEGGVGIVASDPIAISSPGKLEAWSAETGTAAAKSA